MTVCGSVHLWQIIMMVGVTISVEQQCRHMPPNPHSAHTPRAMSASRMWSTYTYEQF